MLRICWLFNFPNITRESKLYKLCTVLKRELVSSVWDERTITFNGAGNSTMAETISNKKKSYRDERINKVLAYRVSKKTQPFWSWISQRWFSQIVCPFSMLFSIAIHFLDSKLPSHSNSSKSSTLSSKIELVFKELLKPFLAFKCVYCY